MSQITIKVSKEAHDRLLDQKERTGASIRFTIDKALDSLLGKKEKLKKGKA